MGITEFFAEHILNFFASSGYLSVFVLMVAESMVFPVPSEAVLPPAGLLIAQNKFNLIGVIVAASLGSFVGSALSYLIGKYGGRPFIDKYGKYLLLNHEDLNKSENFFKKHGDGAIFICRFIPVIRHLISLPAGLGKMNFLKFTIFTVTGATIWNCFLIFIGVRWGQKGWDLLMEYSQMFDILILIIIIISVIYFIKRHLKK